MQNVSNKTKNSFSNAVFMVWYKDRANFARKKEHEPALDISKINA